jgi:protease-4
MFTEGVWSMSKRGALIAASIAVGVVLVCAILPLGALALFGRAASTSTAGLTTPPTRWQEEVVEGSGTDRVAIIQVNGVISVDERSPFATQLTQQQLLSQLKQATDDPQVKAVVVRVNSLGGGVVASSELHASLKKLRTAGKRVVISMGDTAVSGGYYIATAGERIYANADTPPAVWA